MKNYLLVIFIFFINYPVKAAFIDNIHKLNISDGLSSGFVYDIVQDNNNLVWIATETGLNRYDGLNVKTYLNEHYNKKSLSNNQVQSLFFDDNNNTLWVGTNYGLNRYNYESDDFTPYYFSINNNKTADIVKILPSESENKLLLCSYYYGLILFDILSEDFYILGDSYLNKESFDALTIFDDKKENIWIGTQSKGIFCFGKNDSVLTNYNIDNNIAIRDFNIDKDENILCATSNGIYIKNYAENKFLKLQLDIYKDTEDFYFIRYINDNEIWIGSEDGIYIYKDLYGNRILNKIDMNETSFGLTFRSVRNIFQDKYMNIWISTYAGGVNYIPGSNPIFRNIKPSYIYNAKDGNDGINKILSITEDKKGNLLLGTDGFGIIKITKNHEFIERYDFNKMKKNINRNIIQSIFCDEEENLWIGTYEAGLIKYNPKLNDYKIFDYSNSDICGNDIRYIDCIDNEIYVCGKTGITIFDKQGSIKRNYRSGYKGLYAHDIRKMINISDDTILFGSYNGGIYIYSKKEDKFNSIQHNESDPSSLPDNMIEDFFYSSDNKLWVSTKNGELAYCENLSGDFTRINLPFTKGNICSIKEDEYGYLWLCYVNCIIRYNTESDQFDIYNNSQVISTGMYFGSAAYKDNNNIYYGGANGIIHFSPEKFITSMRPVIKPVFTDFKMYNNTVRISDENNITPLKSSIITTKSLTLDYNQSVFSFSYVSPNYGYTSELKYAYILLGEDKDWNYVENRTFAEYRNLKHGKYKLLVKVSNQDGIWDMDPAEMEIIIKPPLWKTKGMYILYFLLFAFIIYISIKIIRYRISTYNRLRYLRLEREKTEELYQSKLQFFTNISHEFRTPVTLISNPLEKLITIEDNDEKKYLLSILKRNSDRLLRLINQLLDLRKVDNNGFVLNINKVNIYTVIEDIYLSFKEEAERKSINYSFTNKINNDILLFIDQDILNKTLYNIISNAFKYTGNNGDILIEIRKDKYQDQLFLIIDVKDNGIGISSEKISKIFNRFYQCEEKSEIFAGSGIGLHLVKELMTLHHGHILVNSSLGAGSTFSLLYPAEPDFFKDTSEQSDYDVIIKPDNDINYNTEEISDLKKVPNNSSKMKVLIVDDEPDIISYIAYLLKNNYDILFANNGKEALDFIQENEVDIIISDIMMPIMDGLTFCSHIKSNMAYCHIPVILLTSKNTIDSQVNGYYIGADDYITKPFSSDLLIAKVNALTRFRDIIKNKYQIKISSILESEKKSIEENKVSNNGKKTLNDIFIEKAINLVIAELDNEDLNGEYLASKLNMSRVHLHRKLKTIMNITTSEFIRNIRLNEAAKMLKEDNKNVSEVSYATGFSSLAYFSGCFNKYFGISPKEFQTKHTKSKKEHC